jgi:hypothetical protein
MTVRWNDREMDRNDREMDMRFWLEQAEAEFNSLA